METVVPIVIACVGLGALINAFSATLGKRIVYRVASAGCGIIGMEVGVLRYAAARGLVWATPELRQGVFAWVVGLFAASLVIRLGVEKKAHHRKS